MDDRAGLDRPPDQRARRIQLSAAPASDRWREVKEILADALECDDETRRALLEDVRARDSGLAREVESLLGWYQAPSAAETPPGGSRFRLQPGDALGPYVIEERLDSGGMGVVYRARDTRLNRAVAVKVLDGNMAGGLETLRRFEREARTVASLSHPNILSIFDYGTQGAVAYAVTELLVGSNLRGVLRGGPLPLAKAVGLAGQILSLIHI